MSQPGSLPKRPPVRSVVAVVDISGAVATGIGAGGWVTVGCGRRRRLLNDVGWCGLFTPPPSPVCRPGSGARAVGTMTSPAWPPPPPGCRHHHCRHRRPCRSHCRADCRGCCRRRYRRGVGRELPQARPRIDRPRAAEPTQHQRLGGIEMGDHRIAAAAARGERMLDGLALTGIAKHEGDGRVHGIAPVVVGGGLRALAGGRNAGNRSRRRAVRDGIELDVFDRPDGR